MAKAPSYLQIKFQGDQRVHLMKGARATKKPLGTFIKDAAKAEVDRILADKAAKQ